MRLLVTGGAGFIGSNFVRYSLDCHPDAEIVVLDKLTYAGNLDNFKGLEKSRNFTFVKGDINDFELDRQLIKDCDVVLHLAAESHVDKSLSGPEAEAEFYLTNVEGTKNLLRAATSHGLHRRLKKFIYMSTDEVWGELSEDPQDKFRLGRDLRPTQPYSESKATGQVKAHAWNWVPYPSIESEHHFEDALTVAINCTNVIGPGQFPEKFTPLAITNVLEGKPIRVYGEGRNVREWTYVDDLCRGFWDVINNGRVGIGDKEPYCLMLRDGQKKYVRGIQYIFGSGQEISNLELAKKILTALGRPIVIDREASTASKEATILLVGDRPIHDLRYAVDYSETTAELGWKPEYDLNRALQITIEWYRNNTWWWRPLKQRAEYIYKHGK